MSKSDLYIIISEILQSMFGKDHKNYNITHYVKINKLFVFIGYCKLFTFFNVLFGWYYIRK